MFLLTGELYTFRVKSMFTDSAETFCSEPTPYITVGGIVYMFISNKIT